MKNCIGIINLDENEERLSELTKYRPLASLPIAGRYRVVDFILSNMTNSGIENISLFTKNKARSLLDHLSNGKPWDIYHKKSGLKIFNFGDLDPVYDDVHNFLENIDNIRNCKKEYILICSSYMICNIDYNDLIQYHIDTKNDITIVYKNIKEVKDNFENCKVLNIDSNSKVISIGENIENNFNVNIDMEMYILKTDLFIDIVYKCVKNGMYKKFNQYVGGNLKKLNVGAYEFKGYLSCINSVSSYFNTNMDFLNEKVNKELFYSNAPIYTKPKDACPTQYTECSKVTNSIIANGSIIEGEVKNCIIGRKVYIGKNSIVENCVIFQGTVIGENVKMINVITDKGTAIKDGEEVKGLINNVVVIPKKKLYIN